MLEMEGARDTLSSFPSVPALGRVMQNDLCALSVKSQYFVSFFFFLVVVVVGKGVFKFQRVLTAHFYR